MSINAMLTTTSTITRHPKTGQSSSQVIVQDAPSSPPWPLSREEKETYQDLATRYTLAHVYMLPQTIIPQRNDRLECNGRQFVIIRLDNWDEVLDLLLQEEQ